MDRKRCPISRLEKGLTVQYGNSAGWGKSQSKATILLCKRRAQANPSLKVPFLALVWGVKDFRDTERDSHNEES